MDMTEEYWDSYWESRLLAMENLGKKEAILAASRQIRLLARSATHPLRLLELGSGEGQVLGPLLEAHASLCDQRSSTGIDYNVKSLARSRRDFPQARWLDGDFTDPDLLAGLGKFDLVLLVNALHEVFSAQVSPESGEVDVPVAKEQVTQVLRDTLSCLAPAGRLILFDGLETEGDLLGKVCIRFRDQQVRDLFEIFARQYRPFHITYQETSAPLTVELSRRDFTRYITKSIFLGKDLWEHERFESYQYFSESEFRPAFARLGLEIVELSTLTVNGDKWRSFVEVYPTEAEFPIEHILIVAQKNLSN